MGAFLDKALQVSRGFSYWRVKLDTGRTFSEFDQASRFEPDPTTGKLVARHRVIDWYRDIIGSGDAGHISRIDLITPQGTAGFDITEPYTAFQLKRGIVDAFSGKRYMEAQIIGRLLDRESGAARAHIWDVKHRRLIIGFETTVRNFATWHEDIIPPGALAYEVVGLRMSEEKEEV